MSNTETTDPFDLARATVMLAGYDARWGAEPYEVLAVEAEFRATLRNPTTGAASRTWTLGGKLDAIVRDPRNGRVLIVEHKTSADDISPGSSYWKRLKMDGQVSLYFEGARALGHEADGCMYDVLGKFGQRPSAVPVLDADGVKVVNDADGKRVRTKDGKKWRETGDTAQAFALQTRPETVDEYRARIVEVAAANPAAYFARGEVVRLEGEVADALHDVWQVGVQIREAANAGRYPRNPDACVRYGRTCEFFDVCVGEASLEDPSRFRQNEVIHTELTDADASVLSASRLSCARACQRLHLYRYVHGYRPAVEAEALRFGTLIHRGLEAWWRETVPKNRLAAALAAVNAP